MVVNVFLTSTTVVLNHFAEGSHIQTYDFVREPHKKNYHKSIDTFFFIAPTKFVTQIIRGVTERHCPSKGILSQHESDTKLLQSIYFAYEVGIISSYSDRICYRKIAKNRTRDARELNAALRAMFDNHCSTSNTMPAIYDVTALAIITPKKQ